VVSGGRLCSQRHGNDCKVAPQTQRGLSCRPRPATARTQVTRVEVVEPPTDLDWLLAAAVGALED